MFRLQAHQFILHLGTDQGVERREGFVHQQDRRFAGKRPGKPDALLHAARKLVWTAVGVAFEPDGPQRNHRLLRPLRLAHTGNLQPEGGIVEDGAVRQQRKRLEHHADIAAANVDEFLAGHLGNVATVDLDRAGSGLDQAVEKAKEG